MTTLRVALIASLLLLPLVSSLCGQCGSVSLVACMSETQYYPCVRGILNPSVLQTCPSGTLCGDVAGGCGAPTASCSVCNQCVSSFACTTPTDFVLCSAAGEPTAVGFSCPTGTFCDVFGDGATFAICKANTDGRMVLCGSATSAADPTTTVAATTTTVAPATTLAPVASTSAGSTEATLTSAGSTEATPNIVSSSEATVSTTATTSAPSSAASTSASTVASTSASTAASSASSTSSSSTTISPTTLCAGVPGIRPDPNSLFGACKGFIKCIPQSNGTVIGNTYRCPGKTTFDETTLKCGVNSTCSSA